jgi:peroxiredoxin
MIETGANAPALALEAADGERYSLADALARGPVLLTFFQLECQTFDISYIHWDRAYEEYAGADFQLLAVGLDPEDEAAAFYEKSGVSFPILFGGREQIEAYDLTSTPAHALVDTDGTVSAAYEAFDRESWNAMLATVAGRLGRPTIEVTAAEAPDFRPGCTIHT